MNSDEAFEIWAPSESPWSPWVKPILFASEPDWDSVVEADLGLVEAPRWLARTRESTGYRDLEKGSAGDVSTAFVLDLPGAEGVAWGVMLAREGWRPVPLYNALAGPSFTAGIAPAPVVGAVPYGLPQTLPFTAPMNPALVDVWPTVRAMRRATTVLPGLKLSPTRPPVFLLEASRRMGDAFSVPGRFDNRSISLPTDFPSAVFLRARGIGRIVLVQRSSTQPQEDLAHTLLAWQEGGIVIEAKSLADDAAPAKIEVTRPSMFRIAWYRVLATIGLRRNPLGGFGGTIPVPSAG